MRYCEFPTRFGSGADLRPQRPHGHLGLQGPLQDGARQIGPGGLLLTLLIEDRFPSTWVPDYENRDLQTRAVMP